MNSSLIEIHIIRCSCRCEYLKDSSYNSYKFCHKIMDILFFRIPGSLQSDQCKARIPVVRKPMPILYWNTLWLLGEPRRLRTSGLANWQLLPLHRSSTLFLLLRGVEQFSVNVRKFPQFYLFFFCYLNCIGLLEYIHVTIIDHLFSLNTKVGLKVLSR